MGLRTSGIRNIELLKAIELFPPKIAVDDTKNIFQIDQALINDIVIIARMIDLTMPIKKTRTNILTIGVLSGWTNMVLSVLYRRVYSLCFNKTNKIKIQKKIQLLDLKNVFIRHSSFEDGWKEVVPFEAIICLYPFASMPNELIRQLSKDALIIVPIYNRKKNKYEVLLINDKKELYESNILFSKIKKNKLI